MNAKEQQKLLERLIKQILPQLLVEDDNKKPEGGKSNEELKQEALKIINQLKDQINDAVDNDGKTILDYIQFCDGQGGERLKNATFIELEDAVRKLGGKTAQEIYSLCKSLAILLLPILGGGLGSYLGSWLGAVSESEEQAEILKIVGPALGGALGGSLSSLASIMINRKYERDVCLFSSVSGTGAMFATIIMHNINARATTWSSIASIPANIAAAGVGTALSIVSFRKYLNSNPSPSTTVKQASVSQPIEEVRLMIEETSL